ncbi:phage holin [Streptococcus hyovaginalis]|uniref:phage holin n=1 Tax=Streptococcus hyovaginalis TaxID=149015 RepID=UPI003B3A7F95
MGINWKLRLQNKTFWLTLIPLLVLLLQQVGLNIVPENWEEVFNTIMAILTLIGAVNDPTTKGLTDSDNAMTYDEPK